MIHLKPSAGLCNRMRAIDSALALARSLDTRLDIYWVRDHNLNCPFRRLFEPIKDPRVLLFDRSIRPLRFVPTYRYLYKFFRFIGTNSYAFSTRENERLTAMGFSSGFAKSLTIESFARFYPNASAFSDFKPADEIADRVTARIASFDQHTMGVHVRRTDNLKSIIRSPDHAFIAQMRDEITAEPLTRFYLATDSRKVKETFTGVFGERIITTAFDASRNTIKGVQEALVELYTLASTRKIIGSYWSSYSTTAAELGKIPLMRITTDLTANNP